MLDYLIETNEEAKGGRRAISLKATVALHVLILGSVLAYGWLQVPPIPEPPLQVTFAQIAPPPPPPPPPPPAATTPEPEPEPVMPEPEELVEPEKVPETVPAPNPDTVGTAGQSNATGGVEGGVEGGVPGGVVGGVVGGVPGSTGPEGPLRVGGDVLAPQIIDQVSPIYPPAMRNARLQGVVVLEIIVRRDGKVDPARIKVIRSLGMGATQAAENAVKQWRYRPATRHGIPVDVIQRVEVSFVLR